MKRFSLDRAALKLRGALVEKKRRGAVVDVYIAKMFPKLRKWAV